MALRVKSPISRASRMLYRSVQLLSGIQKEKEIADHTTSHEDLSSSKMSKFNTQAHDEKLENKGLGKEQAETVSKSLKVLRKTRKQHKHYVVTEKDLGMALCKHTKEFKKLELQRKMKREASVSEELYKLTFFRNIAISIGGLSLAILSLLK